MGRESRQARRARQRRENQQRRHHQQSFTGRWSAVIAAGLAALVLIVVAGFAFAQNSSSTTSSIPTPLPGKTIDGISCKYGEDLNAFHKHAHLTILVNGKSKPVPAGIGIEQNTDNDCDYWLHTHDTSGIIHIEAPHVIHPTLAAFFDIWGQPLSSTRVAQYTVKPGQQLEAFVDGKRFTGNPRDIILAHHESITLEIGPPFLAPKTFPFAKFQV